MGNNEAVKIGVQLFVNKQMFSNAVVREVVDELTLREGEAGTFALFQLTVPMWEPADGRHRS